MALHVNRPLATAGWHTGDWVAWLTRLNVVHSVRATDPRSCRLCSAPTRLNQLGTPYDMCFPCRRLFSPHLQRIVPISYSTSPTGLTSLIWQAKNQPGQDWLHLPLASLLYTFLQLHWNCIETVAGGRIDLVAPIPSYAGARGGTDHLTKFHGRITEWGPLPWQLTLLTKTQPSRAVDRRRELDATLFSVDPKRNVSGMRVLLIDDLCTTAGTIASAAYALTRAGSRRPVAVTLGRQVGNGDEAAQGLLAELPRRGWEPGTCAIHPLPLAAPTAGWF